MGAIDTLTASQQLEAIYIGYFGRAADSGGFTFWEGQLSTAETTGGQSPDVALTNVANSFAPQSETATLYPQLAGLTPPLSASSPVDVAAVTNFVNAVYMNVFNHPVPLGDTFWIDQILSNTTPLGVAVLGIENGAIGVDATTLQNKIAVAGSFTSQTSAAGLGQAPIPTSYLQEAHTVVAATTSDNGTVTAQETAITTFVAGATAVPTVPLTPGMDNITQSNVAISGIVDNHTPNQSTLQLNDTINPGGTTNSLAITYIGTAAGGINNTDVPVLSNVQALTVTNNGADVTADLTGIGPSLTSVGITAGNFLLNTTFKGFSGTQITNFTMTNLTTGNQGLFIAPNSGLNTAGVASGAATVTITNATKGPNALSDAPILAFLNTSATDGYSSITLSSSGSTPNELLILAQSVADLTKLTVNGAAALKIDDPVFFSGGVSNVQAGSDQGGISIDLSGNAGKTTFVGGSGIDSLTIQDSQLTAAGTSLDGGTGTNTLTVTGFANTAADYTAIASNVKDFQIFGIATPAETINAGAGGLDGAFQHFAFSDAGGGNQITNMVSNSVVDMLASNAAADILKPAVGANTIDLNIGNSSSAGIIATDTVQGWSTINLTSNGSAANTANLTLSNNEALTVEASGSAPLTLKLTAGAAVSVDASAFVGALIVNDTGHNDAIKTGSGVATINEAAATQGDTITYLSGHSTVDTLVSAQTNNSATPDSITNFALGQDVLKNLVGTLVQGGPGDLATTVAGTGLATGFGTPAAFITAAEATATAVPGHAVAEIIGNDTWVAEFFAAGANHAHIVELVGVHTETSIGGAGASAILLG
jgi:hypothetical protein